MSQPPTGKSNLATAVGSSIMLSPYMCITLSNMGVLGKEDRFYLLYLRSGGFRRGEGVATLSLGPFCATAITSTQSSASRC